MTILRSRFKPRGSGFPKDFETWNILRQSDGFLCRFDTDCQWIMPVSEFETEAASSLNYLESVGVKQENQKFVCQEEELHRFRIKEVREYHITTH